jgi:two-component system NarL family sensor kinase
VIDSSERTDEREATPMAAAIEARDAQQVFDDGAVAAVVVDESGRLIEATSGAASMLGFGRAELRGRSLHDLVADGWGWVVQNALLRLTSGAVDAFDLMLRGRSGRRTLVQMIPRPMTAAAAEGRGMQFLMVWLEQRRNAEPVPMSAPEAELHRLAYGLLRSHEAERSRVASELHDGVAPLVIMAKFMVEDALARLARGAQREAIDLLNGSVTRLREALTDVRRISTDLRPSSLDDLGLLPTLQWYCRSVTEAYRTLHVATYLPLEEAAIPDALKVEIFRIVQEALSNVVRHARATEAKVTLEIVDDRLQLKVEDNGVGFEVEPLLRGAGPLLGVGLHSIRRRIDATHGAMLLDSAPWRGTLVGASWPLRAAP